MPDILSIANTFGLPIAFFVLFLWSLNKDHLVTGNRHRETVAHYEARLLEYIQRLDVEREDKVKWQNIALAGAQLSDKQFQLLEQRLRSS